MFSGIIESYIYKKKREEEEKRKYLLEDSYFLIYTTVVITRLWQGKWAKTQVPTWHRKKRRDQHVNMYKEKLTSRVFDLWSFFLFLEAYLCM